MIIAKKHYAERLKIRRIAVSRAPPMTGVVNFSDTIEIIYQHVALSDECIPQPVLVPRPIISTALDKTYPYNVDNLRFYQYYDGSLLNNVKNVNKDNYEEHIQELCRSIKVYLPPHIITTTLAFVWCNSDVGPSHNMVNAQIVERNIANAFKTRPDPTSIHESEKVTPGYLKGLLNLKNYLSKNAKYVVPKVSETFSVTTRIATEFRNILNMSPFMMTASMSKILVNFHLVPHVLVGCVEKDTYIYEPYYNVPPYTQKVAPIDSLCTMTRGDVRVMDVIPVLMKLVHEGLKMENVVFSSKENGSLQVYEQGNRLFRVELSMPLVHRPIHTYG